MTRLFAFLSCLFLLLGLCIGVTAAQADDTRASSVHVFATVSGNGSCEVSTNVTLHVDVPKRNLTYPIPASASGITLNGKPVLTEKSGQARAVDLSRVLSNMSGDFTFTVGYSIHTTVRTLVSETTASTEEGAAAPRRLQLELPILAGFSYPIDELQFSINLPGTISQSPRFVSGYHQANIEKDLTYAVSGNNIAGRSWSSIKDHETLTMYMDDVSPEMFPLTRADLPALEDLTLWIGILSGVALLYWLLFLRNFLPIRRFPAVAPEGFGAGQLGTVLTMAGAELNLIVFSWAQLGYVTLQMDRRSRVYIHKRMDMGNERTTFEQKCFYQLFSRRNTVDTSTIAYQRMCQTVRLQKSARQLFRRKGNGHMKIFRSIMAVVGLLSGACFGVFLGNMLDYGWLFMAVLSIVGLLCSWHIQFWPEGFLLHHQARSWLAGILCVLWLAIGIVIGQFPLALLAVTLQLAAGFLAAFGGQRTEDGRMAMGQTLSLRRYFRTLTPKQAQQLCRDNPDSFFDLAPFALALGSDKILARRFGKSRLPVCPYIRVSNSQGLTASQWSSLMRQLLDGMSSRQRRKPLDTLRSVMDNYMK